MAQRKNSRNSNSRKPTNRRFKPISRAMKPGSQAEYWYKHPEEVDAWLRAHGIDPEEIYRIVERGGGKLPVGDLGKND